MSVSTARRDDRGRSWPSLVIDLAIIAGVVAVVSGLVKVLWREFTFFGDNAESFFPLWHMYGTALREGTPFLFDAGGWGAANVVGEAAYGVFNPVTIVNALAISFTDRLSFAGFVVMVEFLVLLGWGVYALARSYGASRLPALIVGIMAPFAGYTLFYEAGNWASGLMAVVWVVHFWWAARLFSLGRIGPIWPFVFGCLAVTVGSPYSEVGVLIVLFAIGVELLVARHWRRFGGLVAVGALVGTSVIVTYVALAYALPVIYRPSSGDGLLANSNYLTPGLSDLAAMSVPSYAPRFDAWYSRFDLVPSAYLSWLIVPLLPWLRWRGFAPWRQQLSLLVTGGIFLLLLLGPEYLWLFRWPIRFIEYVYVAVLVLFAVLLSRGLATTALLARSAWSVGIVAVGGYLAISSRPQLGTAHVAMLAMTAVAVLLVCRLAPRQGLRVVAVLLVLGTAIITPWQGKVFGWSHQDVTASANQRPPGDLSVVRDAWKGIDGRVLQLAHLNDQAGTGAVPEGELVFGNTGKAAGLDIMNRYTGINFAAVKDDFAVDYRGSVSNQFPVSRLWEPVSAEYPIDLADAFGLDHIVVSKRRDDADVSPPEGWVVQERDEYRVVLSRDVPVELPALSASEGVTVSEADETGNDMSFSVAAGQDGYVILDRIAWPGYRVELDGRPLDTETIPFGLMRVDLPAGSEGQVTVEYTVPGLRAAGVVALGGMVVALVYQLLWRRRHSGGTSPR